MESRSRSPVLALFVANAVSQTGNAMALVAIPWFVLEMTGSAALTGMVAFFTTVPAVIAGFFGGTLVDRLGFRRMSVVADIASGVAVAAIPLLHLTVGIETWQLMALVFIGALLDAPGATARSSLVPDLAAPARMTLDRAASINQAIQRGSNLAGAPIGGLLVAWLGSSNVLWVDAATFVISALLMVLFVPDRRVRPTEGRTYAADLHEGLRFIRKDRLMMTVVGLVMITNFLDAPLFSVIMPVFTRQEYGSAVQLGAFVGVFGGFALLGSILYAVVGERFPRRGVFAAAFVMVSLPMWALSLVPPLPITMGAAALLGLAAGPINPIISAVAYERIPAEVRGRVLGMMVSGAYVAIPAGVLVAGYAIEVTSVAATLTAIAAAYTGVTVLMWFVPVLREMERSQPPSGDIEV